MTQKKTRGVKMTKQIGEARLDDIRAFSRALDENVCAAVGKENMPTGALAQSAEGELKILGHINADLELEVINYLEEADGDLRIVINSFGGSSFAGLSIYHAMRAYQGGKITTVNYGLAASAASIIFQAGDRREMKQGTQMMIHDVSLMLYGNAEFLRKVADEIDAFSDDYAELYAERSKMTKAKVREMMRDETFLNASQAIEAGLADKVTKDNKASASKDSGAKTETIKALANYMLAGARNVEVIKRSIIHEV